MNIQEISQLRIELKNLEAQCENASLFERCEIEDRIIEIKEQLGEFERNIQQGGECESCSG